MAQESILRDPHTRTREPRKYKVFIHNDDFTPMELVVDILVSVFHKPAPEAVTMMLSVHHSDKAMVGIYTYDIACSRIKKATKIARDEGYPLRLTCTPE